jgi:2,3-bisphosphoglycerate-dependent phosphoglycerate mutase
MVKLFLVRHGESVWNKQNRFTGWVDVYLSENGELQAKNAGIKINQYLKEQNIKLDLGFMSHLTRAKDTMRIILKEVNLNNRTPIIIHEPRVWDNIVNMQKHYTSEKYPEFIIYSSPALTERFYGDLQGLNKDETRKKYGDEQVHIWRRSFNIKPPNGDSLKDTVSRTKPYFDEVIIPNLKNNNNILISAHGNSLRSIIMLLEDLSPEEVVKLELGTGVPIVYDLNENMSIIDKKIL